jgi:esterase
MALLAHSVVAADSGATDRLVVFLHGILGSGANLRSLAKQVCAGQAGLGALLVDLRMHGRSQDFSAPHTVAAAAADLVALVASLEHPIDSVVAHSFGGKVALAYVAAVAGDLREITLLDSAPGPRPTQRGSESTLEVLRVLEGAPAEFASREAFVQHARNAGLSEMLAGWLAMNIVQGEGGMVRFRLNLDAIHALLTDYFLIDAWPTLLDLPGRVRAHVVVGGASHVFDAAARTRAEDLSAASGGRVRMSIIEGAGHWLHVDAFEQTVAAIRGR